MKKAGTAALIVLLVVACAWGLTGTDYAGAEREGPYADQGFEPSTEDDDQDIVARVEGIKSDLAVIQAVLADQEAVQAGRAPPEWKPPPMEAYERHKAPFVAELRQEPDSGG